jgi:hypothetical protein
LHLSRPKDVVAAVPFDYNPLEPNSDDSFDTAELKKRDLKAVATDQEEAAATTAKKARKTALEQFVLEAEQKKKKK